MAYGMVEVASPGVYTFCTRSKDGYARPPPQNPPPLTEEGALLSRGRSGCWLLFECVRGCLFGEGGGRLKEGGAQVERGGG